MSASPAPMTTAQWQDLLSLAGQRAPYSPTQFNRLAYYAHATGIDWLAGEESARSALVRVAACVTVQQAQPSPAKPHEANAH